MITIDDMQARVHKTAVDHGWWKTYRETHPEQVDTVTKEGVDPNSRSIPEQLMLMVTELAEAMEEYRQRDIHDVWFINANGQQQIVDDPDIQLHLAQLGNKPEGF